MNEEAIEGVRVVVPFGKKKLFVGIVLFIHENPPKQYEAKYILHILDGVPLISEIHLKFWRWISKYYMCHLGEVMQAALPAGLKMQSETKIGLNPESESDDIEMDEKEKLIIEHLKQFAELTPDKISELLGIQNCYKYLKSLYDRGLILFLEELEDTYKPLIIKTISIAIDYQNDKAMGELFDSLQKRAPAQMAVMARLISITHLTGSIKKDALLAQEGVTSAAIKALVKKEILIETAVEKDRIAFGKGNDTVDFVLIPAQQRAYDYLKLHFEEYDQALLYGVTSSGKTHVYLRLIEDTLKAGKQVLYLVPEIALTTQLIERVQHQFGDRVVVWHSRFNPHERVELWQAVAKNKVDVVVGPRSAIFLPFTDLGLVIIDEEHETSYKQYDPNPRYNGRDSGIMLSHLFGAKCLLGSATPSVETYANVVNGKYAYAEINERFGGIKMPEIQIVDMLTEKKQKRINGIFSVTLLDEIKQTLANNEQIILFLNRKGYVPITECADCSWTPMCNNCDISLTYYKSSDKLRCHYCGYHREPVSRCVACGSTHIIMSGYGTERVEDDLKLLLPEVPIGRFDYDTTRTKHSHQKIIHEFEEGQIKILIGTQMIAKGLDFEKVRLVGILNADQMLNFPDFRASERAFQLMLQVAGRAGRRDTLGKVLIQTNRIDHPVIHQVLEGNFKEFFTTEIAERQKFRYPPFFRLIKLTSRNKDFHLLQKAADSLFLLLQQGLGSQVMKPQYPPVARIRNYYLKDILIRLENDHKEIAKAKHFIRVQINKLNEMKEYKSVYIHADVDPY
jgi:primosomal protein N' (replication factor Y)